MNIAINASQASSAASTAASNAARSANALGQQDFLTLMTAQLQNQNPLAPMENGEFLAQMAQFSTVSGIDRMNDTLSSIGEGMRDFRIATASNMLGHSVLVPSSIARADESGAIHGAVDLEDPVSAMVVSFSDARTGQILHSESYGAQSQGMVGFAWEDVPADLVAARAPIRVTVQATSDTGTREIGSSVYARVISARTIPGESDVTLQVEDYGALNALEIEAFR